MNEMTRAIPLSERRREEIEELVCEVLRIAAHDSIARTPEKLSELAVGAARAALAGFAVVDGATALSCDPQSA